MARHMLDDIDHQILSLLSADGRMTNVDLAGKVGITAPPCLRRVRALEKAGYIRGYHADLDLEKLGCEVQAFVSVTLIRTDKPAMRSFEQQAKRWPEVRALFAVIGDAHFILRCVANNFPEFTSFTADRLAAADNIASFKTALVAHGASREPWVLSAKAGETGLKARKETACA